MVPAPLAVLVEVVLVEGVAFDIALVEAVLVDTAAAGLWALGPLGGPTVDGPLVPLGSVVEPVVDAWVLPVAPATSLGASGVEPDPCVGSRRLRCWKDMARAARVR